MANLLRDKRVRYVKNYRNTNSNHSYDSWKRFGTSDRAGKEL